MGVTLYHYGLLYLYSHRVVFLTVKS
jgi:hypothetical protein